MSYDVFTYVDTSRHGTGGTLNIRSGPDRSLSILKTVPNLTSIYIDGSSESNGWVAVKHETCQGYAMSKFIYGTAAYNADPSGGTGSSSGGGNYPGEGSIDCKARTTQSIPLYASADTSSAIRVTIPAGQTIAVDSAGVPDAVWLRAVYNNKFGCVKHATLNVLQSQVFYGVKACERYGEALLRQGSTGNHVLVLNQDLHPLYPSVPPSNTFGAETLQAVRDLQNSHGLSVDGIVGTNTKEKLYRMVTFG